MSQPILLFMFQFLLIFRKAADGDLLEDSGLNDLYKNMTEIDVDAEGVSGAKDFFMSKVCMKPLMLNLTFCPNLFQYWLSNYSRVGTDLKIT